MYPIRHYVRIDDTTQEALAEICRYTFSTKSALMRRYIQEGAERDASLLVRKLDEVKRLTDVLSNS